MFQRVCLRVSPHIPRYLNCEFFRRTLYDMAINCTWLSYRRGRVMCIDLEPVPMLKSGDKDCVSQSGSGVGTLIAVM